MDKLPLVMIIGPTASGKTAAAIGLAQRMGGEIVSADSIQIYQGLDIGSAKPTKAERRGIPHYMLDVAKVQEGSFSVAEYKRMAARHIEDIAARGKLPMVVGGTGLYINALAFPLDFTEVPADPKLRALLNAREAAQPGCLHAELQAADPKSAQRLHKNDIKRIVRALEVYRLTGKTLEERGNDFSNTQGKEIPYDLVMLGLTMPREILYARINARVDAMLEAGLLDEVERIARQGYDPSLPALQGLGYKQLLSYINGSCTLEEAIESIKRETRRFAKRQMTWFRRDGRIKWFDASLLKGEELLGAMQKEIETGLGNGK